MWMWSRRRSDLAEGLANLGITQKQLVEIGIMCGTDYNAGLYRVGPKTALKLIREKGDLEAVLAEQEEKIEASPRSGSSSCILLSQMIMRSR